MMKTQTITHRASWRWRALAFFGIAPVALAIACSSTGLADTGDGSTPDPDGDLSAPTQPAGELATPAPGLPAEIRGIVAAFTSGDYGTLGTVFALSDVPCGNVQGMGAPPPCPAGVAEGTPIKAFLFGVCEGSYLYADNYREVLVERFGGSTFYAAYERTDAGTAMWPKGEMAAIFRAPGAGGWGFTAGVQNGNVVNLTFGCGTTPSQIAGSANDRGQWLVAPAP